MRFIDSHCHVNFLVAHSFATPLTAEHVLQARVFVDQARSAGVDTLVNIGTSVVDRQNPVLIAHGYPEIYEVVGVYPTDLHENWRELVQQIHELVREKEKHKIVGIGEIGIDLYRPGFNLARQIDAFKAQIELALEHDLALVIHSRAAAHETLDVLHKFKGQIKRGVMHGYLYDERIARDVLDLGLYFGVSGAVTYDNNEMLHNVVRAVSLENIVLESDAPWRAPEPYRNSSNTPAHLVITAQFIAQLKGISLDDVARVTMQNTQKLFNLA